MIHTRHMKGKKKPDLWAFFKQLEAAGIEFAFYMDEGTTHRDYNRDVIEEALRSARAPAEIFGHSEVDVEKAEARLSWDVSTTDGQPLLSLHWRHAFDWESLLEHTNAGSLVAALEACLQTRPLTKSDRAVLLERWPHIALEVPYSIDGKEIEWEAEPEEEPEPELDEAPVDPGRTPSLVRKIQI